MRPRPRPRHGLVWLASVTLGLTGCNSPSERAGRALQDYEAAISTGDLPAARTALLSLVAAKDDSPEYWAELGRLQLATAAYPDAYYAYSRAHELDRGNTDFLANLAQIALRGGNLDAAEEHAKALRLVAPSDPTIKLVLGYVALRRGDFTGAQALAGQLLEVDPYASAAKVLKARAILRSGQPDEAVDLLREQIARQPFDAGSLRALVGLLDRLDRWPELVTYGKQLLKQKPEDTEAALLLLEGSLRNSDTESAISTSRYLVSSRIPVETIDRALDLWSELDKRGTFVRDAMAIAPSLSDQQRIVVANYLIRAGQPDLVKVLLGTKATLPVTPSNADANAAFGAALIVRRQWSGAMERIDGVLAIDSNHPRALAARAEMNAKLRRWSAAIEDARRLVAIKPSDVDARLHLATILQAANQQNEARRVLWNAFREIPTQRRLFEALRPVASAASGNTGLAQLQREFDDQRDQRLMREFV